MSGGVHQYDEDKTNCSLWSQCCAVHSPPNLSLSDTVATSGKVNPAAWDFRIYQISLTLYTKSTVFLSDS